MSDVTLQAFRDWCGSPFHPELFSQPMTCIRIGDMAVCEDCLSRYLDGFEDARDAWWAARVHLRDVAMTVAAAERLVTRPGEVLGLPDDVVSYPSLLPGLE